MRLLVRGVAVLSHLISVNQILPSDWDLLASVRPLASHLVTIF